MNTPRSLLFLLTTVAAGALARPAPVVPAPVALDLQLVPYADKGEVNTLEVRLRFATATIARDEIVVYLPMMAVNVDTAAESIASIEASDAQGTVQLAARASTAEESEDQPLRVWTAPRALSGPLTLRYRVPANATRPPRGPAPPIAFRNDDQAFSAAASVFLVVPPKRQTYLLNIDWDLSHLPDGAKGVSSFGEGDVRVGEIGSGGLSGLFFMAGQIGHWPGVPRADRFSVAWQGQPPFDANALSAWVGKLHDQFELAFPQRESGPYTIFLRYNPVNAGGGTALNQSFVTTYGEGDGADLDLIKITLSHEMFHTYQPRLAQHAAESTTWFSEGSAVFYEALLPLRFGLLTPQQFLDSLNITAARYYTNALGNLPNARIDEGFWKDTRIRTLAYDRGMLYLATVNDALRKRSQGRRSLDDLLRALLAIGQQREATQADWEALLKAELGDTAVQDFHAFLAGTAPLPASDAFGPCFRRTSKPLRRYVLGFEPAVLAEPKRVVRGLIADSAAARAGVRNGDEIVRPVPQDGIQGNQTEHLHLRLRRDDNEFDVDYLPRGEQVDTWQWERVPGVEDAQCRL
ncbi:peptidase M61 [Xanthomonas prunicola]|uniref:Peptidase M61 n=1 Tax=Xanthomonas prunicola TaxID=2053930 RepID=A0A2N3RF54_9XANT|nr:peptidase M61 [Xanthomonas prunicola]PKV11113.1 peptidase M61 [Xanthomonas prunicola]PKV15315.1 peptidase M61 [Xanthomonas prunicola]PKV19590.1 peptidase M61 [Xanthomonas prunicola]